MRTATRFIERGSA